MTIITGTGLLDAALVHRSGSMLRFTTRQLAYLPLKDCELDVVLPDGQVVVGRFHRHAQNPYVAGRQLISWIKSWLPPDESLPVRVSQVGSLDRVLIEIAGVSISSPSSPVVGIARALRTLAKQDAPRRRVQYERWERNASLRTFILSVWTPHCQVVDCNSEATTGIPRHLAGRLVDVHHLNHVSMGGGDSPLNLAVLCVMHHQLVHRAPKSRLLNSSLIRATIGINGTSLEVVRDVGALMAVLGNG